MTALAAKPIGPDPVHADRVHSIETRILRIPTIREHKLSSLSVTDQAYVLVRLKTEDGLEGIGEATTLGGPRWAEESVETIKAIIDTYLAPALIGHPTDAIRAARTHMDQAAKRNNAAKSAIETALFDVLGKRLGVPVSTLLGGAVRSHVPVLWALASGDPVQEIEEALSMIEAGRHREFKIKIGAQSPVEDVKRLETIVTGLGKRGHLKVVDVNQAWDESTADRYMPALEELDIGLLEQPVPDWNINGMARLATRHRLPILADESVFSSQDAARVSNAAAADAISLKLVKSGGLLAMRDVAAIADASGLGLYGGCLLESAVGTAAHLHVFATLPNLQWGTESFGPLILRDEIAAEPLTYRDFGVAIPDGPGLGVTLDEDKVAFFAREGGA
ncbi:MAG: muconate/chloromuconate family cycloisomerase [Pseudomonadota bacterium]